MDKVIFIGGIGRDHEFGGELSKNKLILSRLAAEGFSVRAIDTYGSHRNPLKILGLPFAVLKNLSAPIVFSTNYSNIRILARLVRMTNYRRKIIFWAIGGRLGRQVEDGIYSARELKIFDRIIVESRTIASQLQRAGVMTAEYLPNFKNGKLSVPNYDKVDTLSYGLKCVFFSRIQKEKGVDIILDALKKAESQSKNITVDFYGEVKAEFKDQFFSRLNDLKSAKYCGTLDFFDGSGQKTLSDYHLSLFPTYWPGEGFPGVIVDALMAGVPVLSSDWNFNSEYISDNVGFICRPKDTDDFTETLFSVYENRMTLAEMFEACRREGANYDVSHLLTHEYLSGLFNYRKHER